MTVRRHLRRFPAAAMVSLLTGALLLPGGVAAAQDEQPSGASPATAQAVTADAAQEFLDTRLPELLEVHDGVGAAASIVQGGQMVASGGYGYADFADQSPILPDQTVFAAASVSKSFTAMAVLQLAERGEVDLYEDINAYLPETVEVEDTYPGDPVTLHHLLNHTGGFEEAVAGGASTDPTDLPSLEERVAGYDVDRVRPPGLFPSYSNYGIELAGLIVQEVSGVAFGDYVQDNIFAPLGMDDSAFGPIHELREEHDIATFHGPDKQPALDLHVDDLPSGGAVATVEDMSRFMLALLEGGEVDGERVLSETSVEMMLDRQTSNNPGLNAVGYGTYEIRQGPPRVVGHHGDLLGVHTGYQVVPELDTGIYVAVNSDEGAHSTAEPLLRLRVAVLDAFLAEFAPAEEEPRGQAAPEADLDRYAGTYLTTRRTETEPAQALYVTSTVSVRPTGDGALEIIGEITSDERWLPAGGGVFVAENGRDEAVFLEQGGELLGVSFNINATDVYEPIEWYEHPMIPVVVAGAALLVLLTALAWPVAALVRAIRGRRNDAPRNATLARVAAGLVTLACVALIGVFGYGMTDQNQMVAWLFDDSPLFTMPLTLGLLPAAITVVAAVVAWARGWWGVAARVHYTLVALAAVTFMAVGGYFNLLMLD